MGVNHPAAREHSILYVGDAEVKCNLVDLLSSSSDVFVVESYYSRYSKAGNIRLMAFWMTDLVL